MAWDVPYEAEGSAVALKKGNDALLAAVNGVIAEVKEDGTMDQLVAEANELASDSDNVFEGMLEDETASEAASTSEAASASSAA